MRHKKITPNGIEEVEMTQAEIDALNTEATQYEASATLVQQQEAELKALKASAKAKLISGEALTEAEADTLVL